MNQVKVPFAFLQFLELYNLFSCKKKKERNYINEAENQIVDDVCLSCPEMHVMFLIVHC